jgi:hypothetical protein
MKKIYLSLIAPLCAIHFSYAQTNTFPTSGNVGIGTVSPTEKLVVNGGDIVLGTNAGDQFIKAPFYGGAIRIRTNLATTDRGISLGLIGNDHTSFSPDLTVIDNGNVGIGTTSPQALFDIGRPLNSGDLGSVLARLPEGNTTGGGTYLGVKAYNTQTSPSTPDVNNVKSFAIEHSFYGVTNSSVNFLRGGGQGGGSIAFNTDGNTEKMRITGTGNVGIGTTTPDATLAVKGTVHATEVKVDLNVPGPDYVFQPDYKLSRLGDIKAYVEKNHHLPEIPSAGQMAKDGLNLGNMNIKLLKKVEELTLYLIEKDTQVSDQSKQLAKQKELLKQQEDLSKQQERRITILEAALSNLITNEGNK